ncbi:B3/B4 domain-containing protein [Brevundimonas sp. NPDC055812]
MDPPVITPEIYVLRPDFAALSILVAGARNGPSDPYGVEQLRLACRVQEPEWAEAHLDAWRDAYRAFGGKPQRTPCSVEALRKRAQRDGNLPPVSAVVDLYNAVSLRYALPIGGEDADAYVGTPSMIWSICGAFSDSAGRFSSSARLRRTSRRCSSRTRFMATVRRKALGCRM